jgi:hypothetical protein
VKRPAVPPGGGGRIVVNVWPRHVGEGGGDRTSGSLSCVMYVVDDEGGLGGRTAVMAASFTDSQPGPP